MKKTWIFAITEKYTNMQKSVKICITDGFVCNTDFSSVLQMVLPVLQMVLSALQIFTDIYRFFLWEKY